MALELGGGCQPGPSLISLGYFFLHTMSIIALGYILGAVLWGVD